MKQLSDFDKGIVDEISKFGLDSMSPVYKLISNQFITGKCALLILDDVYLVKNEDFNTQLIQSKIVSFISLINELKSEGYIILVDCFDYDEIILQDDVSSNVWISQGNKECSLGKINVLENKTIQVSSESITYKGKAFSKDYSRLLKSLLYSYVCPTERLMSYKKDGYVSEELAKYKKELCHTRIGLIISLIALAISLISPYWITKWQTNYNNNNAYSTLVEYQYSDHMSCISDISYTLDSIFVIMKEMKTPNTNKKNVR